MQVGVFGGICLLACLLSEGRGDELDIFKASKVFQDEDNAKENVGLRKNGDLEVPSDLKSGKHCNVIIIIFQLHIL